MAGLDGYGGLSLALLLEALKREKMGDQEEDVYGLVTEWKSAKASDLTSRVAPRLRHLLSLLDFAARAIQENDVESLRRLADALREREFVEDGEWDHDPMNWWQFHLFRYIQEHPKPVYPIRELWGYLQTELGHEAPSKPTLRRFCREEGIQLNSRPGAPKRLAA